jgi:hypothetical protein
LGLLHKHEDADSPTWRGKALQLVSLWKCLQNSSCFLFRWIKKLQLISDYDEGHSFARQGGLWWGRWDLNPRNGGCILFTADEELLNFDVFLPQRGNNVSFSVPSEQRR